MHKKSPRSFVSVVVSLTFLSTFSIVPSANAYHAVRLSDKELDTVFVGGFDIDINAVLAFRSSVASQNNIAAVGTMNPASISISAQNKTLIRNVGDSAVASQSNFSVIFAEVGDIADAIIKNLNFADVSNIFTEEGGVQLSTLSYSNSKVVEEAQAESNIVTATPEPQTPVLAAKDVETLPTLATEPTLATTAVEAAPMVPTEPTLATAAVEVVPTVATEPTLSTAAVESVPTVATEPTLATAAGEVVPTLATEPTTAMAPTLATAPTVPTSETSQQPEGNLADAQATSIKINEVTSNASAVVAQTNIAAVIAPHGNIKDVQIGNTNIAKVRNEGNSALAVQTNVSVLMAGGTIENTKVRSRNIADVKNKVTTEEGGANVTSISFMGNLGKVIINRVSIDNLAKSAQTNITFVMSNMKNSLKTGLSKKDFFNF